MERMPADQKYRVSVICWGNICRSPMGEFMLRQAFEDVGLSHVVQVDSRGTSAEEHGNPMDRRTIAALRRHGIRDTGFAQHRARRFRAENFDDYDLVLATDHLHDEILRERARGEDDLAKIRMLRSFDPAAMVAGQLGMDDPWYGNDHDFDITFEEVDAAVPGIVDHVRSRLT